MDTFKFSPEPAACQTLAQWGARHDRAPAAKGKRKAKAGREHPRAARQARRGQANRACARVGPKNTRDRPTGRGARSSVCAGQPRGHAHHNLARGSPTSASEASRAHARSGRRGVAFTREGRARV